MRVCRIENSEKTGRKWIANQSPPGIKSRRAGIPRSSDSTSGKFRPGCPGPRKVRLQHRILNQTLQSVEKCLSSPLLFDPFVGRDAAPGFNVLAGHADNMPSALAAPRDTASIAPIYPARYDGMAAQSQAPSEIAGFRVGG